MGFGAGQWMTRLSVPRLQVPADVLTDEHDTTVQPKCLASLRHLKLKEGTVTVAPSLCVVLDEFLAQKGYKEIEKLLGRVVLLSSCSTHHCCPRSDGSCGC